MLRAMKADKGTWVIADDFWLPGAFESKECALVAGENLTYEQLQELQDFANERAGGAGGVIADEDVKNKIEKIHPTRNTI